MVHCTGLDITTAAFSTLVGLLESPGICQDLVLGSRREGPELQGGDLPYAELVLAESVQEVGVWRT